MSLDLLGRCWGFPDKGFALGERQFRPSEQHGNMGRQGAKWLVRPRAAVFREGSRKGRMEKREGAIAPRRGEWLPMKTGHEAWRAGRSHEGDRGRCVSDGFTLRGSYSRLLQHLSADPQMPKGHTTCLGHTVSEWPRFHP